MVSSGMGSRLSGEPLTSTGVMVKDSGKKKKNHDHRTTPGGKEIGKTEKGFFTDIGLVDLPVDALSPLWTVLLQHAGPD